MPPTGSGFDNDGRARLSGIAGQPKRYNEVSFVRNRANIVWKDKQGENESNHTTVENETNQTAVDDHNANENETIQTTEGHNALPLLRRRGITRNLSLTKKRDAKKKRKEGVELSEIELFELSQHSKKNGSMVNDKAKETLLALIQERMKELHDSTSMMTKEISEKEVGYVPGQPRPSKSQAANFQLFRAEIEKHMKRKMPQKLLLQQLLSNSMLNKRLLRIWNNNKEKQKRCTSSL
ncbi:hypothetical protein ACH5RR_018281 [Cinchona calisaya]|uniref:Uncharacterized protein n=1 Tax=Cinchona calisaya TaxID=153742 RepID=A0ABD2ZNV2_9GENT